MFVVPYPIIVVNLPLPYAELNCKDQQLARFFVTVRQTNRKTGILLLLRKDLANIKHYADVTICESEATPKLNWLLPSNFSLFLVAQLLYT